MFSEFPPVSTEKWEEVINKDLKGADYEKKLVWKTIEGFKVKPYYRAEDLESIEYLDSNPGQAPYTRGKQADCNVWDIRQDITEKDPAKANAFALDAVKRGATAVGFCAKAIETEEQMATLLKDIYLTAVSVHFNCSKDYLKTLQLFVAVAKKNGFDTKEIKGTVNFDIFAHALKHGAFRKGEEGDYAEAVELLNYAKENLPKFRVLAVNGKLFANAGSNIVQELGFSLAEANELLAKLSDKGCDVTTVAKNIAFNFATGGNYFMEIAKIRAARMLWSKIVEQYKPSCDCACKAYINATSLTYNKSIFDPYVNMLRTTTETMSAAIAGADSISVAPFDIAFKEADDFSYRIARNQQLLLKEESYLDKIVDPAAGSYYIENLTDSIAQYAWQNFVAIEDKGGLTIEPYRGAEAFEHLRLATEQSGKRPKVFLLTYGNLAMRRARSGFATNFFGVAGYEIVDNNGFATAEEGVKAALEQKADIVVLCSSDDEYAEITETACNLLKGKVKSIVLAGFPKDMVETYKGYGIDEFIHVKTNVLESLTNFQKLFGIL